MIKEVQPKSVVKCEETVHKLPRKLAYIVYIHFLKKRNYVDLQHGSSRVLSQNYYSSYYIQNLRNQVI